MNQKIVSSIQTAVVVTMFSLLAMGIARGEGMGWLGQSAFFTAGALLALAAVGVTRLISFCVQAVGGKYSQPRKALAVSFYAFCGAFGGTILAIYFSRPVGALILLSSIVVGGCSVVWGHLKKPSR
ncbi:hypothetical protein [Niveibacterium sp. SC-1]|uniref:hypothetical protein n=1 Tax=Niveibacterium sp. SC-1 TaxID=3135646 RepID=UPI00311F74D0